MQVSNYKDGLAESPMTEEDYRADLLRDVNKMTVFGERLVFHREDEYIVGEDTKRVKHYFAIDHEDDLNGKRLKYVGDVEQNKKEKFLRGVQKKIDDIDKRDGYGRPKVTQEELKDLVQSLYNICKDILPENYFTSLEK